MALVVVEPQVKIVVQVALTILVVAEVHLAPLVVLGVVGLEWS